MKTLTIRGLSLWIVTAVVGCAGSSDEHAHDDAVSSEADVVDGPAANVGDDASDAASDATCTPACVSGQLCCLDVHGHNPTCVTATSCL